MEDLADRTSSAGSQVGLRIVRQIMESKSWYQHTTFLYPRWCSCGLRLQLKILPRGITSQQSRNLKLSNGKRDHKDNNKSAVMAPDQHYHQSRSDHLGKEGKDPS